MSSKKKSRHSGWSFCESCSTWFPASKDCTFCCVDDVTSPTRIEPSLGATIKEGVFAGFVEAHNEKHLLRHGSQDVLYLHPSTMAIAKLHPGERVSVNYKSKRTLCICWPGKAMNVESVSLSASKRITINSEIGEIIEVKSFPVPLHVAEFVTVETETYTVRDLGNLEESLSCFLDGSDILVGDIIQKQFLGTLFQFEVKHIQCSFHNEKQTWLENEVKKDEFTIPDGISASKVQRSVISSLETVTNKLQRIHLQPLSYNDNSRSEALHGGRVSYPETEFVIRMKHQNEEKENICASLIKMGGYERQVQTLRESIHIPLKFFEVLKGKMPFMSNGLLLHGPPGTGKTLIANRVIKESNLHCIKICGPEIVSKFYGETESKLRGLFDDAFSKSPCIIFIDELDALCPKRDDMNNETEKRVVSTLLTLMDSLSQKADSGHVIVIGATNRLEAVDTALRRPGRFDKEIEIGVPNTTDRIAILKVMLSSVAHDLREKEIIKIAEVAHGYVGADLSAVVREAFQLALKRAAKEDSLLDLPDNEISCLSSQLKVIFNDFEVAMQKVRPSALRALTVDVPRVRWVDVGGQCKTKQLLREAVEWPLKHAESFKRLGVSPPSGVLLYGPPGCSKTLLAKALATESGLNFISVKGPEIFSKFLGESEKAIRVLFQKARTAAPSIIFFDELDALGTQRSGGDSGSVGERVLAQMLTEMDGIEGLQGVVVVAATNRPDLIDSALLRPGRIDRIIYVPLPDKETRKEIFKIQFKTMPVGRDVDLNLLVEMTTNYSGAEICALCKEAAVVALRENINTCEVAQCHFDDVIYLFKPRTNLEQLKFYEEFSQKI